MAQPYGARGSFVLLRPKNRGKLLTQSAENRICMCMGKWAFENVAILFLKDEYAQDNRIFLL